ncbi:hypothetical protein SARC_15250 [Sphaeroforma arctica JP610]|uniref:Uncharacterized protein n=1 Tax=Sphaeroforma arctica JP610 TaxID=667725 RepID=A0A0L0F7U8_9EUKA|nr:hypothetical protein SARC_15250 [Sphaeroforma arctica JP610]KNC72198.1 hypothetical protein SARC_15250 [Sphaeroforma arctica JP610]|eukprot:XP_014146100.1 hypothetical protein SARC_15250 [Sphaeroforma arctica JP610]
MSLAPVAMYEQLIWKDPANYGCIEVGKHLLQPPEEEVPNIPEESQVMDRNSGTKTGTSAGQDRGEGPEESTRKSTQTQGVNDTFDLNNMSMDLGVDTQELSSLPTQAQGSSLDLSQNAQRMPDDTLLFSDTELDMDMDSAQPIQSDTTAHGNIYGKESGNDIDGNHGNGAATDDMDEDDDIYNDINNNNNRTDNGIRNNKRRRGKCQINDSDVSSANEDETDTEPLEEGTQHVNERRKEDQIIMKWNMSQYLPQEVQTVCACDCVCGVIG